MMASSLTVLQSHTTLLHKSLEALSAQVCNQPMTTTSSSIVKNGLTTTSHSNNANDNSGSVERAALTVPALPAALANIEGWEQFVGGEDELDVSTSPTDDVNIETSIVATSEISNQSAGTVMRSILPPQLVADDVNSSQNNTSQDREANGLELSQREGVNESDALSNTVSGHTRESNGDETNEICQMSNKGRDGNANSSNKDVWTCPVCTFINPMLFLTCDACGTTSSARGEDEGGMKNQRTKVTSNKKQNESKQNDVEDEKRQEEKARKRRAKTERKKAAKMAQEMEERKAAAEAEEQRRLDAKREKLAAMAKHEEEVQQQQKKKKKKNMQRNMEVEEKKLNAESTPFVPSTSTSTIIGKSIPRRQVSGKKRGGISSSPSSSTTKTKKETTVAQLSYYIKSTNRKGSKNISPIFDLLQTESTAEKARQLLVLEGEIHKSKEELKELVGKRTGLLNGIGFEERIIKQKNNAIEIQKKKIEWWLITAMKKLGDARGNLWQKKRDEEELKAEEEPLEVKVEETVEGIEFDGIPTLDELLERGSSFLTCSASKYALWLNDQGIETSTDLGIAVIEKDIASMTSSDGYGVKLESFEAFTTLVLYAVTRKKRIIQKETDLDKKKREDKGMLISSSIFKSYYHN